MQSRIFKTIIIPILLLLPLFGIISVVYATDIPAIEIDQGKFFTKKQAQKFLEQSIPPDIVEEKITFLVNEDFAQTYPDWKLGAADIIEYVNSILAKNTKKRLVIARYLTYPVPPNEDLDKIFTKLNTNKKYLETNNVKEKFFGGLQVVYYVGSRCGEMPRRGGGSDGKIFGKNHGFARVCETEKNTGLFGKKLFQSADVTTWLFSSWENHLLIPLHEIGHALGLAHYDHYEYDLLSDNTKTKPFLPLELYASAARYPLEPMGGKDFIYSQAYDLVFSDFNATLINKNLTHSFTGRQLFSLMTRKVILRVEDENGKTIQGALVKVFDIERDRSILRQTIRTNKKGEVKIKAPLGWLTENGGWQDEAWLAEIIKVSKNGKRGAGYIDALMLQDAFVLGKKNTYFLDVIIR